jgi:hypothetical protein
MITRLVVEFNRKERRIIADAALSLGVAFPEIHQPAPARKSECSDAQRDSRRVIAMGDGRASEAWSHDQIISAVAVMATQVETLKREASLDYWLAQHGETLPFSDEPTSAYQQYRTLTTIRGSQLIEARRALLVLQEAACHTERRQLVPLRVPHLSGNRGPLEGGGSYNSPLALRDSPPSAKSFTRERSLGRGDSVLT